MAEKKIKQDAIADLLSRHKRTIQRWNKDFKKRRMASLFSGHMDNENASKLTRRQKKEIKAALKKPPSKYGLPKEFWDVPQLKSYVKAEFGVVYESVQSYHFLLKFSNLSFKKPAKFDIKRDEQKIIKRMRQIRKEISPLSQDDNWEIFTADETRIVLEAITRKAWLTKGKKTILKVKRERQAQSYIGLLNQKDYKCHVYELAWQNQEEIIKAIKKLLKEYPAKKVCIIWDNAMFHKGKKIRKELEKGRSLERVHLINLPPYAPDMNPVEHIWEWAKTKISNNQQMTLDKVKEKFKNLINSRRFEYHM